MACATLKRSYEFDPLLSPQHQPSSKRRRCIPMSTPSLSPTPSSSTNDSPFTEVTPRINQGMLIIFLLNILPFQLLKTDDEFKWHVFLPDTKFFFPNAVLTIYTSNLIHLAIKRKRFFASMLHFDEFLLSVVFKRKKCFAVVSQINNSR